MNSVYSQSSVFGGNLDCRRALLAMSVGYFKWAALHKAEYEQMKPV